MDSTNIIFDEIIEYPRDLLQFYDQELIFEVFISNPNKVNPALNILIMEEDDLINQADMLNATFGMLELNNRPTVYLIDSGCLEEQKILDTIKKFDHNLWYYKIYNSAKKTSDHPNNRFFNKTDLFRLIKQDFKRIKATLIQGSTEYLKWTFNAKIAPPKKLYDFNPLKSNYITLETITNKTWSPESLSTRKELALDRRSKTLISTSRLIDKKHILSYEKIGLRSQLPILILVAPFFNPSIKNILWDSATTKDEKLFSSIYGAEQDLFYQHFYDGKENPIAKLAGEVILVEATKPKLKLLDAIAYLHSSFTFSPTLRLPATGKLIYKELSHLNPSKNKFNTQNVRRKIFESIENFGKKLASLSVSMEVTDFLHERNGQILAISDLPIEWLIINDVPLSFTHDVCRIPESNYRGAINNYSAHNKIEFTVKKNILAKTLIILSADVTEIADHEFRNSYELVKKESKALGYQYAYCKTVKEVSEAIAEVKPDFLIFDCHGDIDPENDTSYLIINGERLYGDQIVDCQIGAPIVFLSCCNSNPNYGYLNKLHDAFFDVGAATVTSTFLPISITRGTRYYIRLLFMLKKALEGQNSYKNWLEFISHIIRSSIIHEPFIKIANLNRELNNVEELNLISWLTDIQDFSKRPEIFKSFLNEGINLSDDIRITIEDSECEFLLYSHYGRPDLITFDSNEII